MGVEETVDTEAITEAEASILFEFDAMTAEERCAMFETLFATWCPECGETHEECLCEGNARGESSAEDDG